MVISIQSAIWCILFSWNAHGHSTSMMYVLVLNVSTTLVHQILKVSLSHFLIDFNDRVHEKLDHLFFTYLLLLHTYTPFFVVDRNHIISIHIFIARFLRTSISYTTTTATAICFVRLWGWRCIFHVIRMWILNEIMIASAAVLLHYQKELVISIVNAFVMMMMMIKKNERGNERKFTSKFSNCVIIWGSISKLKESSKDLIKLIFDWNWLTAVQQYSSEWVELV